MTKVLVAGGAGFIASHLIDRLLARTSVSKIVVVDNLWTGSRENLAHLYDPRLVFDRSDVERVRSDMLFDEIYHMASPASPKHYAADPTRTISANVLGAFRLRELLNVTGTFCYTSTSEVYGEPDVSPQPESYRGSVDCTGPRSSYDESKRCTEAFLFECKRVHAMNVRVVRLFNVYGPRTRPDDGRAVPNFISQALAGRPLTVYGDGQQTRSWGYIDDITDALERIFWGDCGPLTGPINVGNDREVSVLEIAKYVVSLVPGARIEFAPPAPHDPTNRRPDLSLAKRVIPGWECRIPYEEGLLRTLDWFSSRADTIATPVH